MCRRPARPCGLPLTETLEKVYFTGGAELSPLACAYVRARGADRMSSFGDWISLSDVCDESTARTIQHEVSDGVLAPGYTDAALEILKQKRKGGYNIVAIDADYVPAPVETKEVFGVTFEQGRNEVEIMPKCFPTSSHSARTCRRSQARPAPHADYAQIYAVQFGLLRRGRTDHRRRRRTAVAHPLHAARR